MNAFAVDHPDEFHTPVDVRQWLARDPVHGKRYRVSHQENADFLTTQISVLDDSRFYQAVLELSSQIEQFTSSKILPLYCSAGIHRVDAVSKATVNRVLNKIEVGLCRSYNAKIFSCQRVEPKQVEDTVVVEAKKWLSDPWTQSVPDEWGKQAGEGNSRAHTQLTWLDELCKVMAGESSTLLDDARMPIEPLDGEDEADDTEATDEHKDARSRSPKRIPKAKVPHQLAKGNDAACRKDKKQSAQEWAANARAAGSKSNSNFPAPPSTPPPRRMTNAEQKQALADDRDWQDDGGDRGGDVWKSGDGGDRWKGDRRGDEWKGDSRGDDRGDQWKGGGDRWKDDRCGDDRGGDDRDDRWKGRRGDKWKGDRYRGDDRKGDRRDDEWKGDRRGDERNRDRHDDDDDNWKGGHRGDDWGLMACLCCGGSGVMPAQNELWAACDSHPKVWEHLLQARGVDEDAMADWFALCEHSRGRDKALGILHNVLKKNSGGYACTNPSGFVVKCVQNAWNTL